MENLGLVLLFAALLASGAPPDVRDIVRRSAAAIEADFRAAPEFSYIDKDITQKLDSQDRALSVSSETYKITMIDGSPYRRLVARDGEPVSGQEQAREEEKLQAATERRRRESPGARQRRIAKFNKSREDDAGMMREMTRAFTFTLHGEQMVNGRQVYVLDAKPNPSYRPPNEKARALTGMEGKLWIDKQTCQWVKVVAEVIHPVSFGLIVARLEPGTRIILEQMPVEEGIWLTKRLEVKLSARYLFLFGHRSDEEDDYSGYERIGRPIGDRR
jgi:hypothetical protein